MSTFRNGYLCRTCILACENITSRQRNPGIELRRARNTNKLVLTTLLLFHALLLFSFAKAKAQTLPSAALQREETSMSSLRPKLFVTARYR